jgi:hypothetical protein
MEVPQGNSQCSYLKQQKYHFLLTLLLLLLLQNQRMGGQNRSCLGRKGLVPVGGGGGEEMVKEDKYVQILCTQVCRRKNDLC